MQMKTVKVTEVSGAALDWLVAKCEGEDYLPEVSYDGIGNEYPATRYSTNWEQGGPIIEQYGITISFCAGDLGEPRAYWIATTEQQEWAYGYGPYHEQDEDKSLCIRKPDVAAGPTPLIAAMRCYCCSKLGDEVKVPEEL